MVFGLEIVLFTRGPVKGKPMIWSYKGVSAGANAYGTKVGFSVAALNLYKPYGMIDDMFDKRIRADDGELIPFNYHGNFFGTQVGMHNTIYDTTNGYPAPFNKITWFGEGSTPTSFGVSASLTDYRFVGYLMGSDVGKVIQIDKTVKQTIDEFNKLHPKDEDKDKPKPPTLSQGRKG